MANQREALKHRDSVGVYALLDVKYVAGFVDADGSIMAHIQKRDENRYGLYPKVNIGQLTFRDNLLREISEEYDVNIYRRESADMSLLDLTGTKAERFLQIIKKHLVIKDDLAEYVLNLPKEVSKEELKEVKKTIKFLRKKDVSSKNHPSRKWMAGYIDGDGCFTGRVNQKGVLTTKLTIASSCDALAGINLIKKAFGGSVRIVGNSSYYELSLGVSKTKELYEFCGKHLRIKMTQMALIVSHVGENKHSKSHGATEEQNREFCRALATTKYIGRDLSRML